MLTKSALIVLSLALGQLLFADTAQDIDDLLQKAKNDAKQNPLSWKKLAIQTGAALDAYDAQTVTNVLYARLNPNAAGGSMQTIVSRIAHTTKAFSPDAWLAKLGEERDPFTLMAGMHIFYSTEFKDDARFKTLLKNSLKDTRVGRRLIGEERAYSDEGLRICDTAYNLLMSDRFKMSGPKGNGPPPAHPVDVGISKANRNGLIMKLCAELGVSGPLSQDEGNPASQAKNTDLNEKTRGELTPNASQPNSAEKASGSVLMSLFALLIVSLGFAMWWFKKRRK